MSKVDVDFYKNNDTQEMVEAVAIDYVIKPDWYNKMFIEGDINYPPQGDWVVKTTNRGVVSVDKPDKHFVIRNVETGEVDVVVQKDFKKQWTLDHTSDSGVIIH